MGVSGRMVGVVFSRRKNRRPQFQGVRVPKQRGFHACVHFSVEFDKTGALGPMDGKHLPPAPWHSRDRQVVLWFFGCLVCFCPSRCFHKERIFPAFGPVQRREIQDCLFLHLKDNAFSTISLEPKYRGDRWWNEVGRMSKILFSPLLATPPDCSATKAKALHS